MSDIAPFYAGGDEVLEFEVRDRAGESVADGTAVELRVAGVGVFEAQTAGGKATFALSEEQTSAFGSGVHPYHLVAIDGDDTAAAASGNIVSTTLIPREEESGS